MALVRKIIKFFAKININSLAEWIFCCIFASRKEIDARLQHYFINVQEKLLINIMFNQDLQTTILLNRMHVEDIEKNNQIILRKNEILSVRMPNGEYKILLGDGKTSLNKLRLEDTLIYDPNEVYISGRLIIKSHNENE